MVFYTLAQSKVGQTDSKCRQHNMKADSYRKLGARRHQLRINCVHAVHAPFADARMQ